jgi:hypothetical protein
LLVASFIGWSIASIALLVPLTFGLMQRQRTRKTLVRVGRARSWVGRPGEGVYSHQPSGPEPTRYGGFEDEDRIVERRPGYGLGGSPFPDSSAPGPGGPGFGGPGPGPGFGGPPQDPSLGGPGTGGPVPGGSRLLGGSRPGPGPDGPGFGGGPAQGGPDQGGWR